MPPVRPKPATANVAPLGPKIQSEENLRLQERLFGTVQFVSMPADADFWERYVGATSVTSKGPGGVEFRGQRNREGGENFVLVNHKVCKLVSCHG